MLQRSTSCPKLLRTTSDWSSRLRVGTIEPGVVIHCRTNFLLENIVKSWPLRGRFDGAFVFVTTPDVTTLDTVVTDFGVDFSTSLLGLVLLPGFSS